jgi:predicted aminopeptidase
MKIFKKISISIFYFFLTSCQFGYYFSSAKNQLAMMNSRQPVEKVLVSDALTEQQKSKIAISQKARVFAFEKLLLKKTNNYSTYIDLKRPYVTWVVHAAYKWEMKNYQWSYLFVGDMPYKGFFSEAEALEEAQLMEKKGFDTYVRGVTAYSTLGYLQDSVLSSMLRYKEHDLVNTIIHELVHTTIYIKNNADFNERLAVFIGNKGTELFYKELEGPESATLKMIEMENQDDQLFAQFITTELSMIQSWYKENPQNEEARQKRLAAVITNFTEQLKPQLKTNSYLKFEKEKMNNARLGLYKTYMEKLDDFEVLFNKLDKNLIRFIETVKTLEKSDHPIEDLKKL